MNTISPKEFALSQIAPYFKDKTLCGYDEANEVCCYLNAEGKMCVAGKCMSEDAIKKFANVEEGIGHLITTHTQAGIFKPELVDLLTKDQWVSMQWVHDNIYSGEGLEAPLKSLNLFTFEELVEYTEKLKK